jgi:hypothetical protein
MWLNVHSDDRDGHPGTDEDSLSFCDLRFRVAGHRNVTPTRSERTRLGEPAGWLSRRTKAEAPFSAGINDYEFRARGGQARRDSAAGWRDGNESACMLKDVGT